MIMSSQCICDIVSVCVPHFLAWNNWSMFSECESNLFNFFYKGGPLRRGIGRKSSSSREFSPRVSEVMSLSDTKLQCLLCYKKFSTKEESTAHMMTRHRITLDIDKSMRSVYAWSVRWKTSSWEVKVWWQNVPAKTTCNYGMQNLNSILCTHKYFNLSNCQKNSSGCVFQCLSRWNKLFFLNLTKINIQVMVWDLKWRSWKYRHKRRRRCSEDTTLPGNAVSVTRSGPPRGSLSNISAKLITLAARHSYSTTTASHINQSV